MLFPSIFRENLYDDFFGAPFGFGRMPSAPAAHAMKTDVKETEDGFELTMDLPGFKKEDIHTELKDGCLTVRAESSQSSEQTSRTVFGALPSTLMFTRAPLRQAAAPPMNEIQGME